MATAGGDLQNKEDTEEMLEKPVLPEKHPLQNRWSLWYMKADRSKSWTDNLKKVTSFDTVEDFWAVYNHIKPPSNMSPGCDYMLFKEGIQPMWEDSKNRAGGRWLLNFDKSSRKSDLERKTDLDNCWMETLMCLVGEVFNDSSDEVCGAVVQVRGKGNKMAIWTGNSDRKDEIMTIGRSYKEKIEMHIVRPTLVYQSHKDVSTKTGSMSKSHYTL